MTQKRSNLFRYIFIGALFVIFSLAYVVKLIDLQVAGQDYYTMTSPISYKKRVEKIQAHRGEIYDRNGKPLVTNKYGYNLKFDYGSYPKRAAEKNSVILETLSAALEKGYGENICGAQYRPFNIETTSDGTLKFSYNDEFFESKKATKYNKLAEDMSIKDETTCEEAAEKFLLRYGIINKEGEYQYGAEDAKTLFEYNLDMEIVDFSTANPYDVVKDVSVEFITELEEKAIKGIFVYETYARHYNYPGYASHIIGRIGKMHAEDVEYYTDAGYPLDAIVGTSGVELAFEKYLHGTDGEIAITEDASGNIIGKEVTKEPIAGSDVYLTIDIELQMAAEDALFENVEWVKNHSNGEGTLSGDDCKAGALTALKAKTGEVLAIASYPTYNLETFNDDYDYLLEDEVSPMYNRALDGTYQPGSTFKIGVAAAALDAGIINKDTEIFDAGAYEYYKDSGYTPRCWIYLMHGMTHGWVNVTDAIQVSCNYFFYDIGRQLSIDKLTSYMKKFGLGEHTGIELDEKTGVLAGPDYRDKNGLRAWSPGDTLQAAIGQSDNLFTPLQLSVYISSIVNNGTRYSASLLSEVRSYKDGEVLYKSKPEVVESANLSNGVREVVLNAMKDAIEDGSASSLFVDYPITIGGKTGTAQVSKDKSDNAIFTAFAPFDDPEIVVASVIEQGLTGSNAGIAVRKVFDRYFSVGDYADNEGGEGNDGGEE